MSSVESLLTLKIETAQPIKIEAFVGAFSSLAEEYRREVRASHPHMEIDAEIYVKEVRQGSTIAELLPVITTVGLPVLAALDQALIVEQFVKVWGERISALINGNLDDWKPSKSELGIFLRATQAIAQDPDAVSTLEAATYEDGKRQIKAAFKFTTKQAIEAQKTIEATYRELDAPEHSDHQRVLMVFTRSDVGSASIGKRSGERVKVEELSGKALALMYASDLAEERIKHEIREGEENIYKKGFVVDVNVKFVNGKPSVYAVTNVHEVIDLPENDN